MTFGARRAFWGTPFCFAGTNCSTGEALQNLGGPVKLIASLLAVAAVVACSDAFKPTIDNVVGDYTLQKFETTDTSGTTNWVQRGGTMTISLSPFGTTIGRLFMPGAGEGGADVQTILIG